MQTRQIYHDKLKAIRDEVLKMSTLVEKAIGTAINAFMNADRETARSVIDDDEKVNAQEDLVQDMCVVIIATEQPVAGELRFLISTLKTIRDLERIGDYATHLAKTVMRAAGHTVQIPGGIPAMTGICLDMLKTTMASYMNPDTSALASVEDKEELVDKLYLQVIQELSLTMQYNPDNIQEMTPLLLVAKYLERLADHIIDICEEIDYMVSGKRRDSHYGQEQTQF